MQEPGTKYTPVAPLRYPSSVQLHARDASTRHIVIDRRFMDMQSFALHVTVMLAMGIC